MKVVWIAYYISIFACFSNAQYRCYKWTAEDKREMGSKPSIGTQKAQCEKRHNTFTNGNNGEFHGCGACWCCQKVIASITFSQGSANVLSMWCSLLRRLDLTKTSRSQCSS